MNSLLRRFTFLLIAFIVAAGIIAAPLLPLVSSVQGQNAQSTDIFTGQFIPAYQGAAYDPSEAYKRMAGMPVYVFAYDTWGKIVNNFIYRSQIRADGSFQAAGLGNASHYGICVPVADDDTLQSFRPPIPGEAPEGDGLEAVFAFTQSELQAPAGLKDQMGIDPIAAGPKLNDLNSNKGCRTFLSSSKTVDISNHVNIFPLVPTTVLSVIIKDDIAGQSPFDQFNTNSPYEIFAQRITLNSVSNVECTNLEEACLQSQTIKNSVVEGPVIRGRSIPYISKGASYQGSTIFQAYAPKGVYAITYWRPDTRDATTTITYLTFNGSQSLNTPYNGLAFENVVNPGEPVILDATKAEGQTKASPVTSTNQWLLNTRDPNSANGTFAWRPKPGNLNIWGTTTVTFGGAESPIGGAPISIGNSWFGFLDPMTRTCKSNRTNKISAWGIYMFSTSCTNGLNDQLPTTVTEVSLDGFEAVYNGQTLRYRNIDNEQVTATGEEGPSRYPFPLQSASILGVEMQIEVKNTPISPRPFNLTVNGKTHKHVAYSEPGGRLLIPGIYFAKNPMAKYTVSTDSSYGGFGRKRSSEQLSFVIDGSTLKNPTLALNNLGTINIDNPQSPVVRWLASLNLSNVLDNFHIKSALAYGVNGPDKLDRTDVQLWLDTTVIDAIGKNGFFLYSQYELTQVDITLPSDAANGDSNYVVFDRWGDDGKNRKAGIITVDDSGQANLSPAEGSNPKIVGVRLKEKSVDDYKLDDAFDDYQATSATEKDMMPLRLNLRFQLVDNADANSTPTGEQVANNPNNSVGQDSQQLSPSVLQAEATLLLHKTGGEESGSYEYEVFYDPIALMVRPPGCDYGGHFWNVGSNIKGIVCDVVTGVVNFIGKSMEFIATNLTTVDPLQFGIARDAWNIMRNFVNGLAVVLLLIAGIAIMLRYEPTTFSLQSILTKLLITILLVNFSILIIQFGIDIANVFSTGGYTFLLSTITDPGAGTTGTGATAAIAGMAALSAYVFTVAIALPGPAILAVLIGLLVLFIALAYVLGKAVYYWILRQIILVICIIAAPIALACRIMPGTQAYYSKWKTLLTKTLINQIMFAFVLALGMGMLKYSTTGGAGFMPTLVGLGMAIGLFWYSTKFPQQAMTALEGASGIAIGAGIGKAISQLQKSGGNLKAARARYLTNRKEREDRAETLGVAHASKGERNRALRADSFARFRAERLTFNGLLGLSPDEQEHAEEEGFAKSDKATQARNYRENLGAYEAKEELDRVKRRRELKTENENVYLRSQAKDALETEIEQEGKDAENQTAIKIAEAGAKVGYEDALSSQRDKVAEDAASTKRREMVNLALDRANVPVLNAERRAQEKDAIAKHEGEIRAKAKTYNAANEELLDLDRIRVARQQIAKADGEVETLKNLYIDSETNAVDPTRLATLVGQDTATEIQKGLIAGEDAYRNAKAGEDHPSNAIGVLREHRSAQRATIADQGSYATTGKRVGDAKSWLASGGDTTVTLAKLDTEGNVVHRLGLNQGDEKTELFRKAWQAKMADTYEHLDSTKQPEAYRAMLSLNRQLQDGANDSVLESDKSVTDWLKSDRFTYDAIDPSTGTRITLRGVDATKAVLRTMDVPEEQISNPDLAVGFAAKMLTTDTLEAGYTYKGSTLTASEKGMAKEIVSEDNRAMDSLSNTGSSAKSFVQVTLDPSQTYSPAHWGILPPVGPPQPSPFTKGTEIISGLPDKPIKKDSVPMVTESLRIVSEAMEKSRRNELWDFDDGTPGGVPNGKDLHASATQPTASQYANAIQNLKNLGYKTSR